MRHVAIIRFVYEGRFRRSTDICKFMSHRPNSDFGGRFKSHLVPKFHRNDMHSHNQNLSVDLKLPRPVERMSRINGLAAAKNDAGVPAHCFVHGCRRGIHQRVRWRCAGKTLVYNH